MNILRFLILFNARNLVDILFVIPALIGSLRTCPWLERAAARKDFSQSFYLYYLQGNAYDEDEDSGHRGAGVQCQSQ